MAKLVDDEGIQSAVSDPIPVLLIKLPGLYEKFYFKDRPCLMYLDLYLLLINGPAIARS